jgi:hypothetical protein
VREIPAPLHTSACTTPDLRELARDAPYPVHVNTTGLRVQWSSMAVLSSASPCAEATGNLQRMSDLAAANIRLMAGGASSRLQLRQT